jgi:hypothetical protein
MKEKKKTIILLKLVKKKKDEEDDGTKGLIQLMKSWGHFLYTKSRIKAGFDANYEETNSYTQSV